jgi:fructokinase
MMATDNPIAVAGEALVDFVLEADGQATSHLGGAPYNAARTLGRLGFQPVFVGRLSSDRLGRALRRGLEESGVRLDGVVETDDPTTFARVEVDGDGVANYRFYVDGTSAPGLSSALARAAMPPNPAALHIGGLGLVFEPQASAIASLVAHATTSTLIFVDANCRPAAVPDHGIYRRRLELIFSRADVVKVSDDDLAYLEPDLLPLDAARRLLAAGPSLVLLTRGRQGASILIDGHEAHVDAVPVTIVDTIGAGDAFGAAWLGAWISEGLGRSDLPRLDAARRAAEFASLVAAQTCERAGPEPPWAARLGAYWCLASTGRRAIEAVE